MAESLLQSNNIQFCLSVSLSSLFDYLQASAYLDHKLKWDLFRLPELECFDTMLNKLFRDELIELVKR